MSWVIAGILVYCLHRVIAGIVCCYRHRVLLPTLCVVIVIVCCCWHCEWLPASRILLEIGKNDSVISNKYQMMGLLISE